MSPLDRLRVMMTTDVVGGVWTYAVSLSRALAAQGHEVVLVTMGPRPSPKQRQTVTKLHGVSLVETDLPLEWMDPAAVDLSCAERQLTRLARDCAANLVHLNSFREAAFDWPVPVLVAAHSCVNSWAEACDAQAAFVGKDWQRYTAMVKAGLHSADLWVAPTDAFRDSIMAVYRPATPGQTVRNGVERSLPRGRSKRPFVLGAGRVWDDAKNLRALARISANLDWPIRIAGATVAADDAQPELSEGVTWLGMLSQSLMLCEMSEASVFCSPALYEPFGLSVLEAASAGCALVLSDIPSFRELWEGAALFVPPRDDRCLMVALNSLCRDESLREKLQRAARERSLRYSLAQTCARYRDLYAALVDQSSRAGSIRSWMELSA